MSISKERYKANASPDITAQEAKERITLFIKNNFLLSAEPKELNDGDSFFRKGIIDSTGVLELVSFIEQEFDIKVKDEELLPDNLDSINKVLAFVITKRS